jgi:hypothetical protein
MLASHELMQQIDFLFDKNTSSPQIHVDCSLCRYVYSSLITKLFMSYDTNKSHSICWFSLQKKRKKKTMCTRGAMRQGLAALNFNF